MPEMAKPDAFYDCKPKTHIIIIRDQPRYKISIAGYSHEIVVGIFLVYCIRVLERFFRDLFFFVLKGLDDGI